MWDYEFESVTREKIKIFHWHCQCCVLIIVNNCCNVNFLLIDSPWLKQIVIFINIVLNALLMYRMIIHLLIIIEMKNCEKME